MVGQTNAEDVAQAIFINLHRRYDDHNYTDAQLKAFTRNQCLNFIKKQKRNKRICGIYKEAIITHRQELEFDVIYTLHKMVKNLPRKTRMCVQLYYFEHKTNKEVATIVGIKTTTVTSILNYGRRLLRNMITEKNEL